MISSQDGTEDRRPRAAFRLWRVACSPAASAWAGGTASAGGAAGAAGAAGGAGADAAESPPAAGHDRRLAVEPQLGHGALLPEDSNSV